MILLFFRSTGRPRYTNPQDGTKYEWDPEKQAWFPVVDEDFMANYQANYGSLVSKIIKNKS